MNIAELTPDAELKDGKWFSYDGAEFFIAPKARKFETAIIRATRHANATELKKKPELMQDISIGALADTVLLDWKGVKNGTADFPPTRANKITALGIPDFRDWVSEIATSVANFKAEALAEDAAALKSGTEVAP